MHGKTGAGYDWPSSTEREVDRFSKSENIEAAELLPLSALAFGASVESIFQAGTLDVLEQHGAEIGCGPSC